MIKRLHIFFSGSVQGVGFRFTAVSVARPLDLKGWVKNLSSGEVEIVAEGEEPLLKKFVAQLQHRFSDHIADTSVRWEDPSAEFKEFGIRS
jgi:acylphosphatase